MNITEKTAIVLKEIDAALALDEKAWKPLIYGFTTSDGFQNAQCTDCEDVAFIAASRTLLPKSLRCLKTAIEGLLANADNWNTDTMLTTLCEQWLSESQLKK